MWKIVGALKASVLYIYIYIYIYRLGFHPILSFITKSQHLISCSHMFYTTYSRGTLETRYITMYTKKSKFKPSTYSKINFDDNKN